MYASEAELNEVKSKLLNNGVLPLDLEAQIEGTFSFRNAGIPTHIYEQVRKAGFQVLERTTIEGRNSEYTIARIPAPATAPAAGVEPHPEALAAQIVHAQMVLQDALGYEENDYDVSLTDLALDIEALQAKLTAAEASRDRYHDALEPFAEAWMRVTYGVDSLLYVKRFEDGKPAGMDDIGIDTSTLEDAHTAWAALAAKATG